MKNKLGLKRHQNGNTYKQTSLSQVQLNALPCPHTHTQCIYGLLNKGYEIKQADTVVVTGQDGLKHASTTNSSYL